jgi:hypothetical protein
MYRGRQAGGSWRAPPQAFGEWTEDAQLIAHGDDKGLFIVMDYAEGRHGEVRAVAEQLSRRLEGDTRPIRLVLLTRSAGDWWIALHDETPEVQNVFSPRSLSGLLSPNRLAWFRGSEVLREEVQRLNHQSRC